jgi:hypothetical protein
MKAFILDEYGRGAALRYGETTEPAVGDDDVLVEVHVPASSSGSCPIELRSCWVTTWQAWWCGSARA